MISIHTFELTIPLSKKEQKKIKNMLNVPDKKENWTSHIYSSRGIQITLYRGKKKKFIYLRYIINITRLFDNNDYLHLTEPSDMNISYIWKAIRQNWNEIGCGISFERFYLSRIDLTCDIPLENETLLHEYIRLLRKSNRLPYEQIISVEGIYHGRKVSPEEIKELQKNCCRFKTTECEAIQCYNKLYELKHENLPIPDSIRYASSNILRIELQIKTGKRLTRILQDYSLHNESIENKFAFFMKNADILLLERLEKIYKHGRYYKRNLVFDFVRSDSSIRNKTYERIIKFVIDCNKNIPLGRCLEIDRNREKALNYLSCRNISPIVLSAGLDGYDYLPDVFELIGSIVSL